MSDSLVERASLERLLLESMNKCRYCGCGGDCCTTEEPGEKCVLIGPLRLRCNGFECNLQYWRGEKVRKRKGKGGMA